LPSKIGLGGEQFTASVQVVLSVDRHAVEVGFTERAPE